MKAIVLRDLGGPETLRLEDQPDPRPGPGEVLVRLKAAALNHRDAWIRQGKYMGIKLPAVLGSDGAGVVEDVGAGADGALKGREVVINPSLNWGPDERFFGPDFRILGMPDGGTYAQYVKVPAGNVHPKPAGLGWGEAAAIPLAGLTAYRALASRAAVKAGETVFIPGIGGGVATFALIFAKKLGARVFVSSGADEKIERARSLGAEGGVNYKDDKWVEKLRGQVGGGVDVIIDGVGGPTYDHCIDLLGMGGRMATFGATTGPTPNVATRRIFWKQLDLLGTTMGSPADFKAMLALFADGSLRPVVDRAFALADAAEAHRRMDQAAQFGKIVLEIP